MRIVSKNARKSRIPRGKISVIELIEKVKGESELSKREKFEKVIDIAFRNIWNIKKQCWENENEKVRQLAEITQEKNHKAKERGIREAVNFIFK